MTTSKSEPVPGIDDLEQSIDMETGEVRKGPRPALNVLSVLRRGQVMDLLAVELNRVVNGVKDCESGKGGKVSLVLKIDPIKKKRNVVAIQTTVVGVAPEDPPETDWLFYDDDGNLHTRDPDQRDMFHLGED